MVISGIALGHPTFDTPIACPRINVDCNNTARASPDAVIGCDNAVVGGDSTARASPDTVVGGDNDVVGCHRAARECYSSIAVARRRVRGRSPPTGRSREGGNPEIQDGVAECVGTGRA